VGLSLEDLAAPILRRKVFQHPTVCRVKIDLSHRICSAPGTVLHPNEVRRASTKGRNRFRENIPLTWSLKLASPNTNRSELSREAPQPSVRT
jgi:hypothetical protein